jgi:hypothetical protein
MRGDDSSCPECGRRSVEALDGEVVGRVEGEPNKFVSLPTNPANRCTWAVTIDDIQEELVFFSEIDSWLYANRQDPFVCVGETRRTGEILTEWFVWKKEVPQMTRNAEVEPLLEVGILDDIENELNEVPDIQCRTRTTEELSELASRAFERYAERYPRREKGRVEAHVRTWLFTEVNQLDRIPNVPDEQFFDRLVDKAVGRETFDRGEVLINGKPVPGITNISVQYGGKK